MLCPCPLFPVTRQQFIVSGQEKQVREHDSWAEYRQSNSPVSQHQLEGKHPDNDQSMSFANGDVKEVDTTTVAPRRDFGGSIRTQVHTDEKRAVTCTLEGVVPSASVPSTTASPAVVSTDICATPSTPAANNALVWDGPMDALLLKLCRDHMFDFGAVSKALQRAFEQAASVLDIEDTDTQVYTADVCRLRYASICQDEDDSDDMGVQ